MADPTLRTLIAVSRSKPVERALCCPECDSAIELERAVYVCRTCLSEFDALAELATHPTPRTES